MTPACDPTRVTPQKLQPTEYIDLTLDDEDEPQASNSLPGLGLAHHNLKSARSYGNSAPPAIRRNEAPINSEPTFSGASSVSTTRHQGQNADFAATTRTSTEEQLHTGTPLAYTSSAVAVKSGTRYRNDLSSKALHYTKPFTPLAPKEPGKTYPPNSLPGLLAYSYVLETAYQQPGQPWPYIYPKEPEGSHQMPGQPIPFAYSQAPQNTHQPPYQPSLLAYSYPKESERTSQTASQPTAPAYVSSMKAVKSSGNSKRLMATLNSAAMSFKRAADGTLKQEIKRDVSVHLPKASLTQLNSNLNQTNSRLVDKSDETRTSHDLLPQEAPSADEDNGDTSASVTGQKLNGRMSWQDLAKHYVDLSENGSGADSADEESVSESDSPGKLMSLFRSSTNGTHAKSQKSTTRSPLKLSVKASLGKNEKVASLATDVTEQKLKESPGELLSEVSKDLDQLTEEETKRTLFAMKDIDVKLGMETNSVTSEPVRKLDNPDTALSTTLTSVSKDVLPSDKRRVPETRRNSPIKQYHSNEAESRKAGESLKDDGKLSRRRISARTNSPSYVPKKAPVFKLSATSHLQLSKTTSAKSPLLKSDTVAKTNPKPVNRPQGGAPPNTTARKMVEYTREEDEKLIRLKGIENLRWDEIAPQFPNRTRGSLQVHWSTKLNSTSLVKAVLGRSIPSSPARALYHPSSPAPPAIQKDDSYSDTDMDHLPERYEDSHSGCSEEPEFSPPRPVQISSEPTTSRATPMIERPRERSIKAAYTQRHQPRKRLNIANPPVPSLAVAEASNEPHASFILRQGPYKLRQLLYGRVYDRAESAVEMTPVRQVRPYLSASMRKLLCSGMDLGKWDHRLLKDWKNVLLHQPFDDSELSSVYSCVARVFHLDTDQREFVTGIPMQAIPLLSDQNIDAIVRELKRRRLLPHRRARDTRAFLNDARQHTLSSVVLRVKDSSISLAENTAAFLRRRELGTSSKLFNKNMQSVKLAMYDSIGPSIAYTGTSGDVGTIAWAPDGQSFAAGSMCLVDEDSMQYNRPYNLLLGHIQNKILQEVPDHNTFRQKADRGVNSTHSMHVSQDPRLFQTVSMVDFSVDGNTMFSVGYDQALRARETKNGALGNARSAYMHHDKVDLLAINRQLHEQGTVLATGCQTVDNSIAVMTSNASGFQILQQFSSPRAQKHPSKKIHPSCLKWATGSAWSSLLLGGFAASSGNEDADTNGDICIWNINNPTIPISLSQSTRSVFDCSWHPDNAGLIVGCRAGTNVNKGYRSVVKAYWPDSWTKWRMQAEFECEALDMNDVVWSPVDANIITAGCTNGKVYVWDVRKPTEYLHVLEHGRPLVELGDDSVGQRELLDTGVRFSSWGESRSRFYSGSSDGVVKAWDIYRAPEDVLVKDIISLNSGVMCGAFNADFTSLAIGEVNGSITVLEVGNEDKTLRDLDRFSLLTAPHDCGQSKTEEESLLDSGVAAAKALLDAGHVVLRPMGPFPVRQAVQGPKYTDLGAFDGRPDAADLRQNAALFQENLAAAAGGLDDPVTPCKLPACLNAERASISATEIEDSGRSLDRIPHSFRLARNAQAAGTGTFLARAKCSSCGRSARPGARDDGRLLCERCDFACFRCGQQAIVHAADDTVQCKRCDALWRVDILGFKLLSRPERGLELDGDHARLPSAFDTADEDDIDVRDEYYHDWEGDVLASGFE